MRWITEDAIVVCDHQLGNVRGFAPAQDWVTVHGRCVLVERDPEGRTIVGCPVVPPQGKPCTETLPVRQGYSAYASVDDRRVCLDTVRGLTDGVAPVDYSVRDPAQRLVDADA